MYLQKERTPVTQGCHLEMPVLFVLKKLGDLSIQLTLFQSTSSSNIILMNALNELSWCVDVKERGNKKQQWAIEMNESRELYLETMTVLTS